MGAKTLPQSCFRALCDAEFHFTLNAMLTSMQRGLESLLPARSSGALRFRNAFVERVNKPEKNQQADDNADKRGEQPPAPTKLKIWHGMRHQVFRHIGYGRLEIRR